MKMRLTDTEMEEIIYERDLPVNFKSGSGIEERQFQLDYRFGKGSFKEQWFEGIHLSEGQIRLTDSVCVKMENQIPVVEMHFSLSGDSEVGLKGQRKKFAFGSKSHNVFYMPHFEGFLESGKQKESNHVFEVHLSEEYFKKMASSEFSSLSRFAEQVSKQEMAMMSQHNLGITTQMDTIIRDVLQCQRKGTLKRLFIESKVLELLILQVEQFETTRSKNNSSGVKEYDLNKIHHARYLVEKNISQPLSLLELAHQAGLNEFKLKKGFKEVFGNTVFGYLHNLRMEEAKRLLLDHKLPVRAIADHCGYEHVQHFSTAFKKRFGFTPLKYRA